ncbi:MAG: hypothetical protein AB1705_03375 [Verrucomicrobiota bacterium]
MNARTMLGLSVILNVLLVAVVAQNARQRPPAPEPPQTAAASSKPRPRPSARPEPAPTVAPSERFDWSRVESEDYRQYIANLRAIGCPEETIRDLIVADVNKLYARKIAALATAAREFKFWQTGVSRSKTLAENRRQLSVLSKEKWALLRELLGVDAESEFRKNNPGADYLTEELTLGFLPESKRARVREILERYQEMESEAQQRLSGMVSMRERNELKKIRDQRQAELAAVLTPQELEEYELRSSATAESLRARLAGATLTEEQFRQLYRAQKSFEELNAPPTGPMDRATAEARAQAARQLDEQFRAVLGDQAFRDYKRMQDPSYRAAADIVRDYSLQPAAADKVYEIKQAVDEHMRQLMADQSLTREQRMAALKAITEETTVALIDTLGQKGYEAYKQNGGYWIPTATSGGVAYTTTDGSGNVRAMRIEQGPAGGGGGTQGIFVAPPPQ